MLLCYNSYQTIAGSMAQGNIQIIKCTTKNQNINAIKKNAKYQHKIKSPRHLTDDKLFHFHRPMQSYRQHQQPAAAHLHRRLPASSSVCPHCPVSPLRQTKPTGLATEDATSGLRRQQTKLF